ncbi:MAG: STT3 domain-containing protein [Candidatus Woesearchaeota archaeon]
MSDEKNNDDEIDFSFIKKWFKKDKNKVKEEVKELKQEVKEEISEEKSRLDELRDKRREEKTEEARKEFRKKIEEEKEKIARLEKEQKELRHAEKDIKQDKLDEAEKHVEEVKEEEDEIDFSGIKNWFKSAKEEKKQEKEEDEISFDWKAAKEKITDLTKTKHAPIYLTILLLIIPIFLAANIRMQNANLPRLDSFAEEAVANSIKQQIRGQVNQQYPNLPEANKNSIIETEYQKVYEQNKDQINQQIKTASQQFKANWQDDNENTYMPDIDPYYWARYAKNVLDHGYPGDELRDGKNYDTKMFAPLGKEIAIADLFHPYFLAYFHKAFTLFDSDKDILKSIVLTPVFIAALCVIPAFFIARRISGNIGAFFAATMMAVNVAFVNRTLWGHADTDAWNIFFPLFITWLFFEAFEVEKTWQKITFAAVSGLLIGIYSLIWGGWWYISDFIIATIFIWIAYNAFVHREEIKKGLNKFIQFEPIKNSLIICGAFLVSSAVFVTLFSDFQTFYYGLQGPLQFTTIKTPVLETLWPNVLTTVAELNEGGINEIIATVGGTLLLFISILGIVLSLTKKTKENFYDIKYAVFLAIWMIAAFYATTKGIRFAMLIVPPFAIGFGTAIGILATKGSEWFEKSFRIGKKITIPTLLVLFGLLLLNPITSAYAVAEQDIPIINDAWYNTLTSIREDSKENAIVNSWWDFGHHFKWFTERRITFDGATQDTPQAHWIGKVLLTDDEELAVSILRMLDCGGNTAFDEIDKKQQDTVKSVNIVYEIIKENKQQARIKLTDKGYTEEEANAILKNSHCEPPEDYFIASNDMIGKAGVWAHFAAWDFERAKIWQHLRKMPQEEAVKYMTKNFNYTEQKAVELYSEVQGITSDSEANAWVSSWPTYVTSEGCIKENEIFVCQGNIPLEIDLNKREVKIPASPQPVYPKWLVFPKSNEIIVVKQNSSAKLGGAQEFGVLLIPRSEDSYEALIALGDLAPSMFSRMYYLQGHGLKYFTPFNRQKDGFGTEIHTYKVDWNGTESTQIEFYEGQKVEVNQTTTKRTNKTIIKQEREEIKQVKNQPLENQTTQTKNKAPDFII